MQWDSQAGVGDSNPGERRPRGKSKSGKKQKNLYLSAQARQLLALLSLELGISETAIAELLIREKTAREGISIPPTPGLTGGE
jgi:hypothetical protein